MKIIVSKSFRNFVQMRIFIGTFMNRLFPFVPGMVRFGCIPAWLIVRKVREPMAVINPSVSFNGWKPLRSQNKETL